MDGYYKLVVKILSQHGFVRVKGGKGSHEKWKNGSRTAIVQRNMPSKHSANGIMIQVGLDHRF